MFVILIDESNELALYIWRQENVIRAIFLSQKEKKNICL
jgi:hypothetical protein